jgi:hypothetical protein
VLVATAVVFALTRSGTDEDATTTTTTTAPTTTSSPAFTGEIYPLLGTPVPEAGLASAGRPALVVKIDNADKSARPQAGLTNADVVYEPRVEGGVTRFLTVFHSSDANPVGPVRSFRTTDVAILRMLGSPLFAWHGTNEIARLELNAAVANGEVVNVGIDVVPSLFFRDGSRRAPHNSMSNTIELFGQAPEEAGPPPQLFTYGEPAGGEAVTEANVDYGGGAGAAPVSWSHDAGAGTWKRSQAGSPHLDASGRQVEVKNVVIQFTDYVATSQVDTTGAPVPEAQTVGEGEVWVLTEGQRFVGRWSRESPTDVIRYTLVDGSPIVFSPGQTWVNLPPPGRASVS